MKKKMALWKKIVLGIVSTILLLIIVLVITVFAVWHNELTSVSSIKLLQEANEENKSAPVYQMDIKGNYYFDDFIDKGGASNDNELINFIVKKITKGIIPITINVDPIGCSSFTAKTSDGIRLFGRNYDFSTTTGMIIHTKPTDGRYESYSSVDLQFLGIKNGVSLDSIMQKFLCLAAPYAPLDGMNEMGVSCGIYMSYQGSTFNVPTNQNTEKPDITSTTLLRLILDYAANVEEAINLAMAYDLHDSANTSFHYMVADKTGASAILEWTNGTQKTDNDGSLRTLKVYRNNSDSSIGENEAFDEFQYVTNFLVTPGYYEADDTKRGYDRYTAIRNSINSDSLNTTGVITEEEALDVLKLVGRRNWDKKNGVSDSNSITVWSVLYDLTNKKITWVSNEGFGDSKAVFKFEL